MPRAKGIESQANKDKMMFITYNTTDEELQKRNEGHVYRTQRDTCKFLGMLGDERHPVFTCPTLEHICCRLWSSHGHCGCFVLQNDIFVAWFITYC